MGIKERIRNYFIRKEQVRLGEQSKIYKGFDKARSVGLLFSLEDQNILERMRFVRQKLEGSGKEVHWLAYVPRRRKKNSPAPACPHFYRSQTSWIGRPKGKEVDEFRKREYDILIDMNQNLYRPFEYILAGTPATISLGRVDGYQKYYDILITNGRNLSDEAVFEEMLNYLKFVNSHERD